MGMFDAILDRAARWFNKRIQGRDVIAAYRDSGRKGEEYSVESMMSESLANLMLLNYEMPVEGPSARAVMLDKVSDAFCQTTFANAVSMAFLTGDSITIPSWNGRTMDNVIVDAGGFAVLGANGHELTSIIYVVDEKQMKYGDRYTLLRLVELVPYVAVDGTMTHANRYKTIIAKNGTPTDMPLSKFPDWEASNEDEWIIPNVDRLLVGRYRSFTLDPKRPNAQKGVPVCFGASEPIREIHYITRQMHNEFHLSEKAIIADKMMFAKRFERSSSGEIEGSQVVMPEGKDRLFVAVRGSRNASQPLIEAWAPNIQLQPYLDNLEEQFRMVERCCNLSSGVLSNVNDQSYQNVDNVRKSTVKTQSFINTARNVAEAYLDDMFYAWNAILNFYGVTPVGDYSVNYRWSDEYINTFADQQGAILAGESIGATDAVDYRQLVMGESPEVARMRVEEIKAAKAATSIPVFEELVV